jgi:hypothetical protein
MPDGKRARLDIIDDAVGPNESVSFDVLALLFDPGGGLKKREAEGYLVLTSRRIIFATARHGLLIDLARKEIASPASVSYKWTTARLVVETDEGTKHTFVVNKSAARAIAFVINKSPST